ncbi:restriction endonuclease subunit S [Dolichospermum planctonicum CS-1226]|uniref:Restriction endonuclease subunit S n=1 Tax=Dolichospermum planctonicum CS-1226 TaxID=3021751 RepID=A0ABT5AH55_9CYAN|nr:restriction endonuclease subunit S [Dolichospermum planctonicum]MDB9536609.1 restriction endonuclease subunit S [Dolichospermum planctonicum CS-1226]
MSDELLELPEGWELVTLGELCEIARGGSPRPIKEFLTNDIDGVNWIKISDASASSKYIYETKEKIKSEGIKHSRLVNEGDFILSNSMSFGRPYIMKTSGCIHDGWLVLKNKYGLFNQEYLYYFLGSNITYNQFDQLASGSTVRNLNIDLAKEVKVSLPPLNEQKRIVAKIEGLRDRSQAAQKALETIPQLCDRFRQSVLAAAFKGDLTADWREKNPDVEPASVLLERIKHKRFELAETGREISTVKKVYDEESQFFSQQKYSYLPETWISCTINSIGNVCNGSTPSRNVEEYWQGSIPWVSSGEVVNNIIYETREKITELGYKNSSVKILPKGTVLLAMIGQGKTRGQTSILEIEATINQNIAAIILNHGLVVSEYLWYWFQYQYAATRELGSGSGPQALNCQRVREIPLILAPINEQIEIVNCIKYLLHKVELIMENYQQATEKLEKLNQSILSKAFRGELVPQDPEDEPASVLLERIRAEREKLNNNKPKSTSKRKSKTPKEQGTIPGLE